MPFTMFKKEEEKPSMFGPRAASVDEAANRQNLIDKRRVIEEAKAKKAMSAKIFSIPGLIDRGSPGEGDTEIYKQGLKAYLDGNLQGAVDAWSTIPHQPEARRGLQRIYQQVQIQGAALQ